MNIKKLVKEKPTMLINIQSLLGYYDSIKKWIATGDFNLIANANQIDKFMTKYGETCESYITKIKALNGRYFDVDETGNFIFDPTTNKPTLKDGVKMELYNEELKEVLTKTIEFSMS